MPRIDTKFNKELEFRKASGENTIYQNEKDNTHRINENELNKSPESTIDFTPYLREPKYTLEDVILSKKTRNQIESTIVELQYQDLIYKDWGMGEKHKLDKALSINLSGPPGTGKTLTAEAFAHAVKKKILVVPYQQLESKYVGETPKNIAKAFEFATSQNAVLFFDEADSFLGKRLENVSQSTDTAVNLTRSVMILQLSSYEGIVIFATNLVQNYDPAFISRIRWKIQFDLPDEEARYKIWQVQIPRQLPLDKSVDFTRLASQFDNVSGRDIKNAVLKAVVSAVKENKHTDQKQVTQSHFIEAITEIIEANKASVKPEFTVTAVNGKIDLPPERLNSISN